MELSFKERLCNAVRGEFHCGVASRLARWVCDFKEVWLSQSPHLTAPDISFLGVLLAEF